MITRLLLLLTLAFGVGYATPIVAATLVDPAPDAGLVTATAPPAATAPATPAAITVPDVDPVEDPASAYGALRDFWAINHTLAVLLAVLLALRAASARVAWLRVGWRLTTVGGVSTLLASLIDTWPTAPGQWVKWVLVAALGAALTLFQPTKPSS